MIFSRKKYIFGNKIYDFLNKIVKSIESYDVSSIKFKCGPGGGGDGRWSPPGVMGYEEKGIGYPFWMKMRDTKNSFLTLLFSFEPGGIFSCFVITYNLKQRMKTS